MSYAQVELEEFEKMDVNRLLFHAFTRNSLKQVCLRFKGEQGERGSLFFIEEGPPNPSDGEISDMWLDKDTLILYGPKTADGWGEGIPLVTKMLLETSSEGNDNYSIPGNIELEDKLMIPFISDIDNDGPATMDYKGTGNKDIVDMDGKILCNRDIKKDKLVFLRYNEFTDNYTLLDPNVSTIKSIRPLEVDYTFTNGIIDRDFDTINSSNDELADILFSLVESLYKIGIFYRNGEKPCNPKSIAESWIIQNANGTREYNEKNTSPDEMLNILGTLIEDLKNFNYFNLGLLTLTYSDYNSSDHIDLRIMDCNNTNEDELANLLGTIIKDLEKTLVIK